MLAIQLIVAILSLVSTIVEAGNKYPYVFVHGIFGWGPGELGGIPYWGMLTGKNFITELRNAGHQVFEAKVGPLSSNWERAIELYTQIKGGQVDYGVKHSKRHGHKQLGRKYKQGFYPQWGEKNSDGEVQKIHLVGHSMGGQTIRMLAQMLASGTKGAPHVEEKSIHHPLFTGGHKDWVASITTIATPNQGTSLADGAGSNSLIGRLIKDAVAGAFQLVNVFIGFNDRLFDIQLDHWGMTGRQHGESLIDYALRCLNSPIFKQGHKDVMLYDLQTEGAKKANQWVTTLPNVYYYSFLTDNTKKSLLPIWYKWAFRKFYIPRIFSMTLPLQPMAVFLGSPYTTVERGYSESWLRNDGAVNTASQYSDGNSREVHYKKHSVLGAWNIMPPLEKTDHIQACGINPFRNLLNVIHNHVKLLQDLPSMEEMKKHRHLSVTGFQHAEGKASKLLSSIKNYNVVSAEVNSLEGLKKKCAESQYNPTIQKYCNRAISEMPDHFEQR